LGMFFFPLAADFLFHVHFSTRFGTRPSTPTSGWLPLYISRSALFPLLFAAVLPISPPFFVPRSRTVQGFFLDPWVFPPTKFPLSCPSVYGQHSQNAADESVSPKILCLPFLFFFVGSLHSLFAYLAVLCGLPRRLRRV